MNIETGMAVTGIGGSGSGSRMHLPTDDPHLILEVHRIVLTLVLAGGWCFVDSMEEVCRRRAALYRILCACLASHHC